MKINTDKVVASFVFVGLLTVHFFGLCTYTPSSKTWTEQANNVNIKLRQTVWKYKTLNLYSQSYSVSQVKQVFSKLQFPFDIHCVVKTLFTGFYLIVPNVKYIFGNN